MQRFTALFFCFVWTLAAASEPAKILKVEHRRFPGASRGRLVFGAAAVEYLPEEGQERTRAWKYEDIQQLAIAPGRISILVYHRRRAELGLDRSFDFKVLSGTLDESFRKEMEIKLARPLVSAILPENAPARFSIPARHRQFLGDSQGALEFGEDYILYRSAKASDSRAWRYADLLSVGSAGPFQLRLGALQKTGGEFGEEKDYVFDLKRRLSSEEYDFVWDKINRYGK